MKRKEWNEEQLEQLLKQLPPVKDKQTAKDIYQRLHNNQQSRIKSRTRITPVVATITALFIFALISPFLFHNISGNEESAMDMSSNSISKELVKIENDSGKDREFAGANLKQESKTAQSSLAKTQLESEKQETFVTSAKEAEEILTVGFTDSQAKNILPVSLNANEKEEKLEQLEEINPKNYMKELGPITYELSKTDFLKTGNPKEINIEYKGEPNLTSSNNDTLYQHAIIETFRWLDYKKANLFTNHKEGIEFGQTGPKKDLDVKKENKKAYFLYQYDEQTLKLLVPSPDPYDSVDNAIEAMKRGIVERGLKPTIINKMANIMTIENGNQLEIEFIHEIEFDNSESTIIMLESILLTAKEFGFKTVQFKGMNIERVGVMDMTKPIEVPFSPNPIKAN